MSHFVVKGQEPPDPTSVWCERWQEGEVAIMVGRGEVRQKVAVLTTEGVLHVPLVDRERAKNLGVFVESGHIAVQYVGGGR